MNNQRLIGEGNLGKNHKFGIRPNCGPTAVANICGKNIDEVMKMFRRELKFGVAWQGRSNIKHCLKVFDVLGGKVAMEINGRGSLKTFVKIYARPNKKYFVRVGGHFVAIINGIVYDQHEVGPIDSHWTSRKRVSHAYEIETN